VKLVLIKKMPFLHQIGGPIVMNSRMLLI